MVLQRIQTGNFLLGHARFRIYIKMKLSETRINYVNGDQSKIWGSLGLTGRPV
jgi:hypothetical protein